MANYKDLAKEFFNSATGEDHRAWADAAAAYFNSLSGKDKGNFAEAMAAYYAAVNGGDVPAPVTLESNQLVLTSGDTSDVTPSGTFVDTVTFTVVDGAITAIALS